MEDADLMAQIQDAMWDGDIDRLYELARCDCCCYDHTFESCSARLWGGCRGQGSITSRDIELWASHYGMTRDEFLNYYYQNA